MEVEGDYAIPIATLSPPELSESCIKMGSDYDENHFVTFY